MRREPCRTSLKNVDSFGVPIRRPLKTPIHPTPHSPVFSRFNEEGNIHLLLDGAFNTPAKDLRTMRQYGDTSFQAIGLLRESRESAVLNGVRVSGTYWPGSKSRSQNYDAESCLVGDFYLQNDPSAVNLSALRINMKGLEEWLNQESISWHVTDRDGDNCQAAVKYSNRKFEYTLPDASLMIQNIAGPSSTYFDPFLVREVTFKQETWLVYKPNTPFDAEMAIMAMTRLEEFFAILLGAYFRFDWPFIVQQVEEAEHWFKLYFPRGTVPKFEPEMYNILTVFVWVKKSLGLLFSNFLSKREQYGPGYYLFLAGLRNEDLYPEHKFVNLIWALESLHRSKNPTSDDHPSERINRILMKFADPTEKKDKSWLAGKLKFAEDPTLQKRIVDIFSPLPIGLDRKRLDGFAKRCANRRNEISHFGGPKNNENYRLFYQDLVDLTQALGYLYRFLLLQEIGLEEKHIASALNQMSLGKSRILPTFKRVGLA